jgi:superfamily I DNA and/or RNA helicase
VAQQVAIEVAIERRAELEPELRELSTESRLHGFFAKNLENVQGDERDIVILSIGYGRDEAGKLTMNFGPMNRAGGERRLNVAITRARRRVEVVSSIRASEISSDTPSVRHLARYLDYAERGIAALALEAASDDHGADSPFEEEVARVVRKLG